LVFVVIMGSPFAIDSIFAVSLVPPTIFPTVWELASTMNL
jgi:hypothetical protein